MKYWILCCLLLFISGLVCAQTELAPNPGMESGAVGASPEGWTHNSYGELDAAVSWDNTVSRSGNAALRLSCKAFRGGAVQAFIGINPLKPNTIYTLRAWMKSEGISTPVSLGIRDVGIPYYFYLNSSSLISAQWSPMTVIGKTDQQGAMVGIFIYFKSSGTLWLDDLTLLEGEYPLSSEQFAPPVVKGNLVQNSGFELGLQGWAMPEMVAVEDDGVTGNCAHWLNKSGYMLEGRPVELKVGQQYTFSAWLMAPDTGSRVRMGLYEVGGGDRAEAVFDLTSQWQRYNFNLTAKPTQNSRYFISFTRESGADFLVDQVQLEEGELTNYAPAHTVEAGFDLPRSQSYPQVGETVTVGIKVRSEPDAQAVLQLVGTDYFGRQVVNTPVSQNLTQQIIPITFAKPGYVKLALLNTATEPTILLDEAQLCVVQPVPVTDTFFGGHGTEGTPGEYHAVTAAVKGGAKFWRLHDMPSYCQWFMVEPEKGKWTWYDAEINAMKASGLELLGVFCRTPGWAGRDPGGDPVDTMAWPPRDWDEFAEYVYRTVDHYKDRIKYWEAWNEPWGCGFWAGTPEEFAKLQKIVYEQAKKADPDCIIIGGCFWPPMPEFTDRVMAAGGLDYMDAVSYHHYCEPDAVAMGQVAQWYQHMRDKMSAGGKPDMPIYMTEGGTSCPSNYWWLGQQEQAKAAAETVAKHLIQTKAAGAEAFFYYYYWQEIGSPRVFHWLLYNNWTQLDYDGSPKLNYASYAGTTFALSGAKPVGKLEQNGLFAYVFKRNNETVCVLWASGALQNARVIELQSDGHAKIMDMMGGSVKVEQTGASLQINLGSTPVYVTFDNVTAEDLLQQLAQQAVK